MDLNNVPSCVEVLWKTKNLKLSEWCRSPDFELRGNKLCLELHFTCDGNDAAMVTTILWRQQPTNITTLYTCCYVKTGMEKVIFQNHLINKSPHHNILEPALQPPLLEPLVMDKILNRNVTGNVYCIESEGEWSVKCQLSSDVPFGSQFERNKIFLSTVDDTLPSSSVSMCVQGSSKITDALSCDYARLFKQEIFPDFKLSCGGQTFSVHRCVLAARSEVFRAMFTNQMQEVKAGVAVIEDLEVPVLELLLKFIYSGELEDISLETASNLYEVADKYAVKSLMTACSYYMIRNVTVENCVGYLKTADAHSDSDLKAAVASFIIRHPTVYYSASWATFF